MIQTKNTLGAYYGGWEVIFYRSVEYRNRNGDCDDGFRSGEVFVEICTPIGVILLGICVLRFVPPIGVILLGICAYKKI